MRNELTGRNNLNGLARRGFLRAALVTTGLTTAITTTGLSLLGEPSLAKADTAQSDPDQLFAVGLFAAADRGYAKVLAADPSDAHAWAQRGYIALLCNRLTVAERFLGTALRLAPNDQASALRLADCHVRRGDFRGAVPLFTQAADRIDATYYAAVTGTPYEITGAPATTLPFQTLDPLPTVDGAVNGQPTRFVLDTGATFGLSAAAAAKAGLEPVATVTTQSPSGPVESHIAVVGELALGGVAISNFPVMWNASSLLDAPADADGVVGTTILSRFLTTMDYAGRALVLRRGPAAPSIRTSHGTAPLWLAPDHFIFSRGRIGGSAEGLVLLDTGGVGLGVVLTNAQAVADDVTPDKSDPGTYLGVTGYPCTPSQVSLGQVVRQDITGAVGPFQPPADFGFSDIGTLSHEFFRTLSMTLDFTHMVATLTVGA